MINKDFSTNHELDFLQTISKKAIRGMAWVFSLHILDKILWAVKTIILAKTLMPSDFGLMGMALLAMFVFDLFSQIGGFHDFLVQKKESVIPYLNIVWTIQVIQGAIFAGILFFLAPAIALFFKNQELIQILRLISVGFIISGFANVSLIFFRKNLDFHKEFFYQISGTLADLIISVLLLLFFRNVWVLVFGFLASAFTRFILSYVLIPYRPKFLIQFEKFKEIFHFGKWIFINRIFTFLNTQGVDLFVGRFFGAVSLGFYQMSYRFSGAIVSEFSTAITKVTFPVYSKLQDSREHISLVYLKVIKFSAIFSIGIGVNLFIFAQDIIKIFFGERWMPMVQGFRIFSVLGMILPIVVSGDAMFVGKGKPRLNFLISLIKIALIAVLIWPLTRLWGISGAAILILLSIVSVIPLWILYSCRETDNKVMDFAMVVIVPILAGLMMFFVVGLMRHVFVVSTIFDLASVAVIGLSSFLLFLFAAGKIVDYAIIKDIKFLMRNLK